MATRYYFFHLCHQRGSVVFTQVYQIKYVLLSDQIVYQMYEIVRHAKFPKCVNKFTIKFVHQLGVVLVFSQLNSGPAGGGSTTSDSCSAVKKEAPPHYDGDLVHRPRSFVDICISACKYRFCLRYQVESTVTMSRLIVKNLPNGVSKES